MVTQFIALIALETKFYCNCTGNFDFPIHLFRLREENQSTQERFLQTQQECVKATQRGPRWILTHDAHQDFSEL